MPLMVSISPLEGNAAKVKIFDSCSSRGGLAGRGYEVALNGSYVARIIPKRADAMIISAILDCIICADDVQYERDLY